MARNDSPDGKWHCCCCVPLHEGVALIGIYGTSFHTALLVLQLSLGLTTITPAPELLHPHAASVLDPLIQLAHALGIVVNLLLRTWKNKRSLMIPWLVVQGLLALLMAALALYFLVLYPSTSGCFSVDDASSQTEAQFKPMAPSDAHRGLPSSASSTKECTILLWYSVVMVLALLILMYYFYVVQEFLSQSVMAHALRRKSRQPLPPLVEILDRSPLSSHSDQDGAVYVQELHHDRHQHKATPDPESNQQPFNGTNYLQVKPVERSVTFADQDEVAVWPLPNR